MPSERLAAKLARYARLYRFRPRSERKGAERPPPAWQARYPVFPALLVVFAGLPRRELERRRALITGLCRTEPDLERTPDVSIYLCLLEDLARQGPFAAIFTKPGRSEEPVDWLGERADESRERPTQAAEDR